MATTFKDYYEILGVPKSATEKDIKAAFRKLARKYHPDVNPNDKSAEDRFKEINEANEVLGDPEKRKKYDELGPQWQQYEAWERAGKPGPNPFGGGGGVEYRTVSPEDLEELFGSGDPFSSFFHDVFGRSAAGSRRQPVSRRGDDVEGDVTISLAEAYTGCTRTIELSTPTGTRKVQVKVPAGISDGARVRAAGQGGSGTGGGRAGDLYMRVRIASDPRFQREGDSLRVKVPVPLDVALLGGQVEVPTVKGTKVQLTIPAETQNGKVLRLRGLGMPRVKGNGAGDLLAEVDVRLPVPLTAEARKLAEALRVS